MKKSSSLPFERVEGYAPVTFLLSGVLASVHAA